MYRSVLRVALFVMVILALVACAQPTPAPTPVPPTAAPKAAAPTAVPPTKVPPTVAPTATPPVRKEGELLLATTTSTENSGLLKVILPDFEKQNNVKVAVIAVGSGQAIKLGEDGNADVLLVHSRAQEDAFMAAGHGTRHENVMYNDFVLVGPPSDPAGLKGMTDVTAAFKQMADAKAPFVSRGDKSGTHVKELDVWKKAAIEPKGDWYISAGQGMGAVLTMANEQQAYTLSDRATYLARVKQGTQLVVLVEGDPAMFNPYGVITVNPAKNPAIKADMATKLLEWIISVPTQNLIADYGMTDFKQSLFIPDSAAYRASKK